MRLVWRSFPQTVLFLAIFVSIVFSGCRTGDATESDDDSSMGETDDDTVDDTFDDDASPTELKIDSIDPSHGGASVSTEVTIHGDGFEDGLRVMVGDVDLNSVVVFSPTVAKAVFPSIPPTQCGPRDVRISLASQNVLLPDGFEYFFDEDPVVFVHGYFVSGWEWDTMIGRFKELGYPDDYLAAISFNSSIQSSIIDARDELPPFVDEVLARTGAEKVDLISHSNGGQVTRLYIKFYGGADKVRDYVSLAGTHHGTIMGCLIPWLGEASAESCPAYADEQQSYNGVQWSLNGDPDANDVDETPVGAEDGGGIYYHALWTDGDFLFDIPNQTCCLNQNFRNDCSDPVNILFHGVGHIEMAYDMSVFETARDLVREHNMSKP